MNVRVYALLAERVLAAVRAPLEAAVSAWARDWGLEMPALSCRRAWEGAAPSAFPVRMAADADEGMAWLAWPDALQRTLQRALFGSEHGPQAARSGAPELAAAGAGAALRALETALAVAACGAGPRRTAGTEPASALWAPGSGAVLVELRFERHVFGMLLDAAAVARLADGHAAARPSATPLVALDYRVLLARQPVLLAVEAGRADVALGSLLALAPGDVIRLDSLADAPLAATTADGTILLRGYLGARGHHLALDLVAGAESSGEHA